MKYKRICRRCHEIFDTVFKRAKICENCKLPHNPKDTRKVKLICRRCKHESIGETSSKGEYTLRHCSNCLFRCNHKIKEIKKN